MTPLQIATTICNAIEALHAAGLDDACETRGELDGVSWSIKPEADDDEGLDHMNKPVSVMIGRRCLTVEYDELFQLAMTSAAWFAAGIERQQEKK